MKIIVDRIEGEYAVCENLETKEMIDILCTDISKDMDVKEGLCFKLEDNVFVEDIEEEEKRKKRIEEKRKDVWNIED